MRIQRIENERPTPKAPVTVKVCGNVIEVRHSEQGAPEITIEKLSADEYLDKRTGEIKEFQHTENRAENTASVAQTLRNLRDLINANLTDPERALWVTLTYREIMTDQERLYRDFHAFWKRFLRWQAKAGQEQAEYIAAAEPQGRGAWHLHLLLLFPGKAPFIPNSEMARLWGQGFTKTKSMKGVDNPGMYLTAYLGDMELPEAAMSGAARGRLTEVETEDERGVKQKKAIVKGARLHLYPSGFNLYRCSRGVKRPEVEEMTEGEAQELIGGAPLTYEKTIAVKNGEGRTVNVINYRQYNKARAAVEKPGEAGAEGSGNRSQEKNQRPQPPPLTPCRWPSQRHPLKRAYFQQHQAEFETGGRSISDRQEQERSLVVAPIIVRQIGGTVYPVYGYFSPEARETAGEKIGRLLTRSAEKKNAWKP